MGAARTTFRKLKINEQRTTNQDNKVVIQSFGTQSSFEANTKIGDNKMKVTCVKHGMGRIRCACIAANLPMLMNDTKWIFETTSGFEANGKVKRKPHFCTDTYQISWTRNNEPTRMAWESFLSSIYSMTMNSGLVSSENVSIHKYYIPFINQFLQRCFH